MMYAIFQKVSALMPPDEIGSFCKIRLDAEKESKLKSGKIVKDVLVTLYNQDGTDFRDNILTVVTEFQVYKIPRFIKHFITRKK